MMDSTDQYWQSKATCAESSQDSGQTSCWHHAKPPENFQDAPAFEGQTQEIQLMPCPKNHKSWCSPKKTGCTTWIIDPKTHFAFGWFDAISLWKVRKHDRFRNNKKVSGVLEPDLNRQFFEVFLEKLQPFYTFWCELNSEMIWKMTWYSYVTVKICTLYISIIKGYGHLKRSNKTSQELAQLDQVLPR